MKLGVSEAAKWGDRLVSGAPAPQRTLERKKWGDGWREGGAKDLTTFAEKNIFLLNFVVKRTSYPQDGHWELGNLLKRIRKSGNVMGNLVNWMRKSYCAVFGGADG